MAKSGVTVTQDHMREVQQGLRALGNRVLLVGIPEDRSQRDAPDAHGAHGDITNAALGYIHENGAPEVGIPPRPFLVPGVQAAQDKIAQRMERAGKAALDGRPSEIDRQFASCGIEVVSAIIARVEAGLTPALSESYHRRRDRAGDDLSQRKPLIDTRALMNSVTWVERVKGEKLAEGPKK